MVLRHETEGASRELEIKMLKAKYGRLGKTDSTWSLVSGGLLRDREE